MKIGVFDSGVGGLSVAKAIERALPEHDVLYRNDVHHLPYGTKKPEQILSYVVPILESLVATGCQIIVIACNTVSTNLIEELREKIQVPLIAMEPMVKPAALQTKTGVIAICATPATLKSPRYKWLKDTYAKDVKVVEPDCSNWARMIQDNKLDRAIIADGITDALTLGADVIVLGCTHYHWIQDEVQDLVKDKAVVIQPESAIVRQVKRVLNQITMP